MINKIDLKLVLLKPQTLESLFDLTKLQNSQPPVSFVTNIGKLLIHVTK